LGVVRQPGTERFALVHEKQQRGWWLPGGGVDAGQTPEEAVVRETEEEAGLLARVTGLLRLEYGQGGVTSGRLRVIYAAEAEPGQRPKVVKDQHSRGARWVTAEEKEAIEHGRFLKSGVDAVADDAQGCAVARATQYLRGPEPQWISYVARGGHVAPTNVMLCTRDGKLPKVEDPEEEPGRSFYATVWVVRLLITSRAGGVFIRDGKLPWAPVKPSDATPERAAGRLAAELGAPPPHAVLQCRYHLDISDPASRGHAQVIVVYKVIVPDPKGISGKGEWAERVAGDIGGLAGMPEQPLSIVGCECDEIPEV